MTFKQKNTKNRILSLRGRILRLNTQIDLENEKGKPLENSKIFNLIFELKILEDKLEELESR